MAAEIVGSAGAGRAKEARRGSWCAIGTPTGREGGEVREVGG